MEYLFSIILLIAGVFVMIASVGLASHQSRIGSEAITKTRMEGATLIVLALVLRAFTIW